MSPNAAADVGDVSHPFPSDKASSLLLVPMHRGEWSDGGYIGKQGACVPAVGMGERGSNRFSLYS